MTVLNLQVSASGDDGDQNTSGVSGTIIRTELRFGNDSNPKIAGMRFLSASVPQGTTITSATLTVTWSFTYSTGNTIQGNIYGENVDNSAIFTATNGNISGRALTTAVVASGSINNVTLNATKAWTVTTVAQEVINRAGFAGDALSILFQDNGSTNSEWQEIWSYDGSTTKAAKLDIVYTAGGAASAPTSYLRPMGIIY